MRRKPSRQATATPISLPFWDRVERYTVYPVLLDVCHGWIGPTRNGYPRINENGKLVTVHRRVWERHNGRKVPAGYVVCHTCDNVRCTNPQHLFLGKQRDNIADMVRKGRQRGAPGARNAACKLSENDVRAIRMAKMPIKVIAQDFGVSFQLISQIRRREVWGHVT
jgi:hypothetical protein